MRWRGVGIGLDKRRHDGRMLAVGRPHLGAVDDVLAVVAYRARLDRLDIRTAVGLAHREAAVEFAGAIRGRKRCFCSSVPKLSMRKLTMKWVLMIPVIDIHPRAISSHTIA